MSKRMAILASTMLLLCVAAGAAFGDTATVNLHPQTGVTCWDEWSYRWWDLASTPTNASGGNPYDQGVTTSPWRLTFGGYNNAQVSITYNTTNAGTLSGFITAHGLKPNFFYQIKLVGKPTAEFGAAGDDWANEQIGYAGRWWEYAPTKGNVTDATYETYKNTAGYVIEGYLLTGFFVTDQNGDAAVEVDGGQPQTGTSGTVPFTFNSSYHVGCKAWYSDGVYTYQNPDGYSPAYLSTRDSDIVWWHVIGDPIWGYAGYSPLDGAGLWDSGMTQGVYTDYEPGRAPKGTVTLPAGDYNVRFVLTEESFHNPSSTNDGGYWQSAMVADTVQFHIDGVPSQLVKQSGDGQTGIVGTTLSSPLVVKVVDAQGRAVSNATVTFTVTAGGGTVSPTTAVTGADGLAQTSLTLGPAAGSNTVTASVPGCTGATFTATGVATADKVAITSASYSTRTKKLSVTATSDAYAAAKLTMTAYSATGTALGSTTMTYNSRKKTFSATLSLPTAPSSVTVNSSLGGSATYVFTTIKTKNAK